MKKKQNLEEDLLHGSDHEEFIESTIHDYDEDGSNDVKLDLDVKIKKKIYFILIRVSIKMKNLFKRLRT
jgi:hypothetical protein